MCHRDVSKTITTTAIVRNRSSIHHFYNRRQRHSLPLLFSNTHHVHSSCSTDSPSPFKNKDNLAITKKDIYYHLMGSHDDHQDDDNINNNNSTNSTSNKRNVFSILPTSVDLLKEYGAPEPEMSACHLFSQVLLNVFPRWEDNGFAVLAQILQQGDEQDTTTTDDDVGKTQVTREQVDMYASMLERRIRKEPLQYIIGQWDFHNCVLKVRPPCLCPRPETEELVEYVAKDIRQMIQLLRLFERARSSTCSSSRKIRILDVGCGTGAIGIALAKMFPKDVIVSSMDVSEDAVALSVENAKFVLGDDFSLQYNYPLLCGAREYTRTTQQLNKDDDDDDRFGNCIFEYDVVVSNPPYIPSHDMSTLTADVVEYEDYGALCGGLDGLDVVRDIVERLPEWCKVNHDDNDTTTTGTNTNNGGKGQRIKRPFPAVCWMEVDTSHPRLIQSLLANNKHVEYDCGVQDLSGMDRFVKFLVKD